ncbi:MAG: hypothetical protein ABUS54_04190, partial [Actinomycetota bacterium]
NIVIGGQGNDVINTGSGDDDIVGGHNVAGGQDGSDRIDAGAGNDVVAGDNAFILPNGLHTNPLDRTLTGDTIYSPVTNADGSVTYVANVGSSAAGDPTGALERTITLFDEGTTDPTRYGNDTIAGGAGNDELFGQMGNDVLQGDGSLLIPDATLGTASAPGHSVGNVATDGNDYVEGGPGNDLIFGGYGQDDLIGGSSDLFLNPSAPATQDQLQDGTDVIFGGDGQAAGINDPGPVGNAADADVIAGDNADVYRLVNAGGTAFLTYNYDTYGGATRIIPTAVTLITYSPYGDAAFTACNPLWPDQCAVFPGTHSNEGAADFLYGEAGNDVVYGENGDDRIYGNGGDDELFGNSGNDWLSGGTGDDGMLGDDGVLELGRNGVAEPLNNLAATTQVTLSTEDLDGGIAHDGDDIAITVNVVGALNYTAIENPFFAGGNDVMYGGLGNDFMHGGVGDDAMSGAEALPNYYAYTNAPASRSLASIDPVTYLYVTLAPYYVQGNPLNFSWITGLFQYFDPSNPLEKITLPNGVDFLLNFTSALAFDPLAKNPDGSYVYPDFALYGIQPVVDDGQDVLFGDAGNDWLVGGTNQDVLFGGWGNDLLQADDNLDSTKVTTLGGAPVTAASLCSLALSYTSNTRDTNEWCNDLNQALTQGHGWFAPTAAQVANSIDEVGEEISGNIGCDFTADEAATLLRLLQGLKPAGYYDPNANDIVDPRGTTPTFADIAYGGEGFDILIANTASDRLLGWNDPSTVYYYPWEGNADDVVIHGGPRAELDEFVLDLGLALGDDPTRPEVQPWTWVGGWDAGLRNGEPFGELGLFPNGDPGSAWWYGAPFRPDPGFCDGWFGPGHGNCNWWFGPQPGVPGGTCGWWSGPNPYLNNPNANPCGGWYGPNPAPAPCGPGNSPCDWWWNGHDANWWNGHPWWGPGWHGGQNPGLHVEGNPDSGRCDGPHCGDNLQRSLGLIVVNTPTADISDLEAFEHGNGHLDRISFPVHPPVDPRYLGNFGDDAEALLQRIVIRGQMTVAEQNTLSWGAAYVLNTLIAYGWLQRDSKGVVTPTDQLWLQIDLANAPTITSITRTSTPTTPITVTGHGDATDLIQLYNYGVAIAGATGIVDANGNWTITLTLTDVGDKNITATQTVEQLPHVGLTSAQGNQVDEDVYPDAPVITGNTTPGPGLPNAAVTISGTGVAGYTLSLYDGNRLIGSTTISGAGTWSITVSLGVGQHNLSATQTSGNVVGGRYTSDSSSVDSVTVYAPPPAPSITSGSINVISGRTFTVSGKANPNATILLYDGSTLLALPTIVADGSGNWSANVSFATPSTHTLTAKQIDATSGFTSTTASGSVTIKVYAQPAAPTITAVSTPSATSTTTTVTVTGTGVNGYAIQILDNGVAIPTNSVHWSGSTWTATVSLAPGVHSLSATQTQVAGVTSDPGNTFTVTVTPSAPTSLGAPANVVSGSAFTVSGRGIAGGTVTLYDNGVALALPTITVDASGNWSATVVLGSTGNHTLTASETVAGVASAVSSGVVVKVVAPPAVPVITSTSVSFGTVTVNGTGTAGQTITVYVNGSAVGTATVASNGKWSLSTHLSHGSYTITSTQTLYNGTSGPSNAVTVSV